MAELLTMTYICNLQLPVYKFETKLETFFTACKTIFCQWIISTVLTKILDIVQDLFWTYWYRLKYFHRGRGVGLVVNVVAISFNDPSLNPTKVYPPYPVYLFSKISWKDRKSWRENKESQLEKIFEYLIRTWILLARRQSCSMTRVGDFLHFGQLFKANCNNEFAQISYILR